VQSDYLLLDNIADGMVKAHPNEWSLPLPAGKSCALATRIMISLHRWKVQLINCF